MKFRMTTLTVLLACVCSSVHGIKTKPKCLGEQVQVPQADERYAALNRCLNNLVDHLTQHPVRNEYIVMDTLVGQRADKYACAWRTFSDVIPTLEEATGAIAALRTLCIGKENYYEGGRIVLADDSDGLLALIDYYPSTYP
ncbi:hypothetical protein BGZ76_008082 [Entomortierella beljakovae]|nr:hypothetical protein BGZ76_008082 [Entomortierella beljakovae]